MKKILGLAAALAFAGTAAAGDYTKHEKTTEASESSGAVEGTGGSGSMGSGSTGSTTMTASEPTAANELAGKVVRVESNKLYLEHMGAIVPLKISASTKFDDPSLKRAKDIKEGQEVRASFRVENKTENLATSIKLDTPGTGGSGMGDSEWQSSPDRSGTDVHNPGSLPAEPGTQQPLPEDPGTSIPSPKY